MMFFLNTLTPAPNLYRRPPKISHRRINTVVSFQQVLYALNLQDHFDLPVPAPVANDLFAQPECVVGKCPIPVVITPSVAATSKYGTCEHEITISFRDHFFDCHKCGYGNVVQFVQLMLQMTSKQAVIDWFTNHFGLAVIQGDGVPWGSGFGKTFRGVRIETGERIHHFRE